MSKFNKAYAAGFGAAVAVFGFAAILNNVLLQLGAAAGAGIVVGVLVYFVPNLEP